MTYVNRTEGRKNNRINYIVIHYTGNNGDTAANNARYFQLKDRQTSAHYFVDSETIYQCVEDFDTAWSVGAKTYVHSKCRNENSLNIELCSHKDSNGNYYFDDATLKNAVELVSYLVLKYDIPYTNILRHYDVTGKICPAPFVDSLESWRNFINLIKAKRGDLLMKTKVNINGTEFDAVNVDGTNYVKLRDLDRIIQVVWDGLTYDPNTKRVNV